MGILLTIAYDGTSYCGWQVQKNGITICGVLKEALGKVLAGPSFSVLGASRTDAGVHALGQRAHLITGSKIPMPLGKLPIVLNSALPNDIAVTAAVDVCDSFHPIGDAKSKTYVYKINNQTHRNPLTHRHATHISKPLNLRAMQVAAKHFEGEYDFIGFSASGISVKSTVRTIYSLTIDQTEGLLEININGNGFLYNMVRIIAGTLVDVGLGKTSPDQIPYIISSRDRAKAGKTMPPNGLTLLEVFY